ncbi:MAG: triose-phosphate isomerase [Verrucomicrobia bacterium]|nr:triose-phosphate isomerase [Verrucomicrobiota bacterium]
MEKHRKYIIAGNWKLNKTAGESVELSESVVKEVGDQSNVEVVLCPPFTSLDAVSTALEDSPVKLGAQNMHPSASGAYTGEISAEMLRYFYATYVILGHSERRKQFQESDAFINEKVLAAFANNLKPILCVGETLEQREADQTLEVVDTQIRGGLVNLPEKDAETLVIAYEPVWAIGTGKTATPEMAQEVHASIRNILTDLFGDEVAQKVRIQYGGSMNPGNAKELLFQPDIDGGLIGGAALDAKSFAEIVNAARALEEE